MEPANSVDSSRASLERATGGAATSITARRRTTPHVMIVSSGDLEGRWKAGALQ